MVISTPKELKKLKKSGRAIREALDTMAAAAKPGVSTADLNRIGSQILAKHESKSAPPRVYKFPGDVCISVNDEALHGIPSAARILQSGDLLKLDLVAELHGWYTDAAVTVIVGEGTEQDQRLIQCAQEAFQASLAACRIGASVNDIGRTIHACARGYGFDLLHGFGGHGVGKTIHEPPFVPNYEMPDCKDMLTDGMVITIEPIITAGTGMNVKAKDGWTIKTIDGGRVAHYEHTLVVTKDGPVIVTE